MTDTERSVTEATERTTTDAAEECETVCVGATRAGVLSQAVFGSLPKTVGADVNRAAVVDRGPETSAISTCEALLRRLKV